MWCLTAPLASLGAGFTGKGSRVFPCRDMAIMVEVCDWTLYCFYSRWFCNGEEKDEEDNWIGFAASSVFR